MRKEIIRCDTCKKEHDAEYMLPAEWVEIHKRDGFGNDESMHFCSKSCLITWANEIRNTEDFEKLNGDQKIAVNNFRSRVSEILSTGVESFYKEYPELIFHWYLELNVFLRKDQQGMREL